MACSTWSASHTVTETIEALKAWPLEKKSSVLEAPLDDRYRHHDDLA